MKTNPGHSALVLLAAAALAIGCTGTESTSPKPMDRKPIASTPPSAPTPVPPKLTGSLDVRTTGLPYGLLPTITITGPVVGGGAQPPEYGYIMREVIMDALPAGQYYVHASSVRQGRVVYTASPATTSVTVRRGATTILTVPFSASRTICTVSGCRPGG